MGGLIERLQSRWETPEIYEDGLYLDMLPMMHHVECVAILEAAEKVR
jgi:hypothetical protein